MSAILTVNLFSGHSLPRETTENVSQQVYYLYHRDSLVADARKLEERLKTGEIGKGSYRARKAHITRRISHELWVAMHGHAVTAEGVRFRYMPYRDESAVAACPGDMSRVLSSKKLWEAILNGAEVPTNLRQTMLRNAAGAPAALVHGPAAAMTETASPEQWETIQAERDGMMLN